MGHLFSNKWNVYKILVVDDEPSIRNLIERIIRNSFPGCQVHTASNGIEAAEKLLTINPQLAILDLRLPYLNGLDICQLIHDQPYHYHTRVLAMTGSLETGIQEKVFERGASEFLPKPFRPAELAGCIGRLLD